MLLILLVAWATRLHNLFQVATQADEGVHITVGDLVAGNSLQIYADLFENRTPGVEWLLAGWFRLVGPDLFAARVLTAGVILITIALIYTLGRHVSPRPGVPALPYTGLLAAALFALAPLHLFWSRFVMLEHFSTAAAAASILLAFRAQTYAAVARPAHRAWFGAGLLAGLALIFKQSELVLLGAMLAYFALLVLLDRDAAVHATGRWFAGLVLIAAPFLATLALQGTLHSFIQFASTAGQIAPFQNLDAKATELLTWTARQPIPWLILFSLPFVLRASIRSASSAQHNSKTGKLETSRTSQTTYHTSQIRLLLLWFAAEAAFLFLPPVLDLSPGGFSHYLIPVLAPASLLAATGVSKTWHTLRRRPTPRRYAITAAALLLILFITPAWMADLWQAVTDRTYPQATLQQELRIGQAASLLSTPQEPILILGNAIFYHRAQRLPASRYFHWPAYLAQSPLRDQAVAAVAGPLKETRPPVVLVSRLHLQERLPEELQSALWQHYVPAALFSYAYQRDVLAFVPNHQAQSVVPEKPALARFGQSIELSTMNARWLDSQNLLVGLSWRALGTPQRNLTVFVHLLDGSGALVAQDDATPVVGFRPTTTWRDGEGVLDYHWIQLPAGASPAERSLSIGLYDASSGERLPTVVGDTENELDAYTYPLETPP